MDPRSMPLEATVVLAVLLAVVLAVLGLTDSCSEGSAAGCMSSGSTDRPPGIPSFTGLKLGGNVTVGITVSCPCAGARKLEVELSRSAVLSGISVVAVVGIATGAAVGARKAFVVRRGAAVVSIAKGLKGAAGGS